MFRVLLLAALLLAPAALVPLPTAEAAGWCTAIGPGDDHRCSEHVACLGWGYDSTGERCQYGLPNPDWCRHFCHIGPPLP